VSQNATLNDRYQQIISLFENSTQEKYETQTFGPSAVPSLKTVVEAEVSHLDEHIQSRLKEEFLDCGPLLPLVSDEMVTEIVIQGPDNIWYERGPDFLKLEDGFFGETTFQNFFHRVLDEAHINLNERIPCGDGKWRTFRVHAITPPLSMVPSLTLRRQKSTSWTLLQMAERGWCDERALPLLQQLIHNRENILVVGETGCGKTSTLESLLFEIPANERCIIIEDSEEVHLPNAVSCRLLTRKDSQGILPDFQPTDLIRQALRMRPHRLLMGEIRSSEAKDFLLALSTGHRGSLASLHAEGARQALLRLEMLIQMGAPQWSLETVRRLNYVVVVGFSKNHRRCLLQIERIAGMESSGLLLEPCYSASI
jgi:pilus assembly protein CpaF